MLLRLVCGGPILKKKKLRCDTPNCWKLKRNTHTLISYAASCTYWPPYIHTDLACNKQPSIILHFFGPPTHWSRMQHLAPLSRLIYGTHWSRMQAPYCIFWAAYTLISHAASSILQLLGRLHADLASSILQCSTKLAGAKAKFLIINAIIIIIMIIIA